MPRASLLDYVLLREIGQSNRKAPHIAEQYAEDCAAKATLNKSCQLNENVRATFLMVFSPDGSRIASTHGDHSVRITNISTGKCERTLTGHPRTPWCVAFHPTSNKILGSGCLAGEVRIWDLHGGGSEVWRSEKGTVISSVAFHPTEQILVIATGNELLMWNWNEEQPNVRISTAHEYERVRWVRFDHLGRFLYTGICNGSTVHRDDNNEYSHIGEPPSENIEETREEDSRRLALRHQFFEFLERYRYERLRARHLAGEDADVTNTVMHQPIPLPRPTSPAHIQALEEARQYASLVSMDNGWQHRTENNNNNNRSQPQSSESLNWPTQPYRDSPRPHLPPAEMRENTEVDDNVLLDQTSTTSRLSTTSQLTGETSAATQGAQSPWRRRQLFDFGPGSLRASTQNSSSSGNNVWRRRSAFSTHIQRRSFLNNDNTGEGLRRVSNDGHISGDGDSFGLHFNRPRSPLTEADWGPSTAGHAQGSSDTLPILRSRLNVVDALRREIGEHRAGVNRQRRYIILGRVDGAPNAVDSDDEAGSHPADSSTDRQQNLQASRSAIRNLSFGDPEQPARRVGNPLLSSNSNLSQHRNEGESNSEADIGCPAIVVTASQEGHQPSSQTESGAHNQKRNDSSDLHLTDRMPLIDTGSNSQSSHTLTSPPAQTIADTSQGGSPSREHPDSTSSTQDPCSASTSQSAAYSLFRSRYSRYSHLGPSSSGTARCRSLSFQNSPPARDSGNQGCYNLDSQNNSSVTTSSNNNSTTTSNNSNASISDLIRGGSGNDNPSANSTIDLSNSCNRGQTYTGTGLGSSGGNPPVTSGHPPVGGTSGRYWQSNANRHYNIRSNRYCTLSSRNQNSRAREQDPFLSRAGVDLPCTSEDQPSTSAGSSSHDSSSLQTSSTSQDSSSGSESPSAWRPMRETHRQRQDRLRNYLDDIRGGGGGSGSRQEQRMTERRRLCPLHRTYHSNSGLESHRSLVENARERGRWNRWEARRRELDRLRTENERRQQQAWRTLQRRYLHPHYSVNILDEAINQPNDAFQTAINRTIASVFMGSGEAAVANNIVNITHRIQQWDLRDNPVPDIMDANANIVVPNCKLHNDASCGLSQDGRYLATFVGSHRGFPDDTILGVFSLQQDNLGQCVFTKSFGPNAISVSVSPLNNYILVGLAAKRLAWVFTEKQVVAQVFKLVQPLGGESSMKHVMDITHPCAGEIPTHVSVNSAGWLPTVGAGLVYGTNRGDLCICTPGKLRSAPGEEGEVNSNIHRNIMHMLGYQVPRTISTATQTARPRQNSSTQTSDSEAWSEEM
ncbi:activating molecule in BECN1-regulated autophagy protein 1 [Lingula anatina]|uniref:Activating molecule in BECN1-regulated autophagy protein 1 n=1 Tax=Lingula anatina TaxID=7574 RepID=A0A1S3II66_LINAN|nr:activating molecule in BECN1-regulated autophagy protein 1 [Lingula anatina]XP_013397818.1 activating molecule in BECN1-regulated autophagy protein 1 [Lingula anatina]|eukprot:XP_013397817.1 activating molecule in BECN1-regulated autophagy protein 1 [Lingula anatina]